MAATVILKNQNIAIPQNHLTDLDKIGMVMHLRPLDHNSIEIFTIFKIQDGSGRHLEKLKKSWYLKNCLTNFNKIWLGVASRTVDPNSQYKFTILTIQDGGSRHLEKSEKS